MIKRIVSLIFIVSACINISFAQISPSSFKLEKIATGLSKVSSEGLLSNSISDIITIGDTIWVGAGKGLSFSPDRGINWTNYYGTTAFGTESISALAYDHGIVWAATSHSYDKDGSSVHVGSGLRYTYDNGKTWFSIPQPVDDPGDSLLVYGINDGVTSPKVRALPVTVDDQNICYDVAVTKNTVWIATFAGGLRKSNDKGLSWQRILLPADTLNSIKPTDTIRYALQPVAGKFGKDNHLNLRVFSLAAVDDSTIYVGTAGGINRSTDNGLSWHKFNHTNQMSPISGDFVVALAYNKADSTIWGATWKAEGSTESYGVSYSTDKGNSWSVVLEGEKAHNFGFKDKDVIAATDNAAFRSLMNGSNWLAPTSIVDTETKISLRNSIFYAAGSSGADVWLGTADGLAKITETAMWTGVWKVYIATQKLNSQSEAHAFPNPFSPKLDLLKIKYSTNNKTENVTIRIMDFGMNLVKTVIQNAPRGNSIRSVSKEDGGVIDYWNGKDEGGNVVPNGVYFYRIDVGSNDPVFGKIIVLQ